MAASDRAHRIGPGTALPRPDPHGRPPGDPERQRPAPDAPGDGAADDGSTRLGDGVARPISASRAEFPAWALDRYRAVTAEQVSAFARERLANFKVPRHVELVPDLPRNASNKVLKPELRAGG